VGETRPGLTALLSAAAVLLVAGVVAFTIPVTPCPACAPLAAEILGSNPRGETLVIDCPNCRGRRRVTAVSGWSREYYGLRNPWLSHLYHGEASSAWTRPFRIEAHTPEEDRIALPVLIRALRAQNEDLAQRAGLLLGEMGTAAAPAVPELMAALQDRSRPRRGLFAEALGRIGVNAAEGVPLLMQILRGPEGWDSGLYAGAASGLAGYGAHAKPAIPLLVRLLQYPHPLIRASAARTLGVLGPESKVAIPELTTISKCDDEAGVAARMALKSLGVE
jgi:hypothetical protein